MKDKNDESLAALENADPNKEDLFPEISDRVYQKYMSNQSADKAFNRFKDKTYQEGYKSKKLLAYLAGTLMQILGCLLAIFAIHNLLSYLIPKFLYVEALTFTLALTMLVLLEFAKRLIWDELFSEKYKKGVFPISSLIISIVLFGISASSSTIGSYQLTLTMMDSTKKIEKISFDELRQIEKTYQQQIQEYKSKINQVEKDVAEKVKKGVFYSTPPAEEAKIRFYTTQIEKMQSERDNKTGKLENSTSELTTDIQATAQKYAVAGFLVSALFEVLAITCIAYLAYYDFRVYMEERVKRKKLIKLQGKQNTYPDENNNEAVRFLMQLGQQLLPQMKTALAGAGNQFLEQDKQEGNNAIGFQVNKNFQAKEFNEPKLYPIHCPNCGKKENKKSPRAIYCSPECRVAYGKAKK